MLDVSQKRKLAKKAWFNVCHLRQPLICFPLFGFLNCTPSARGAYAAANKAETAASRTEQCPGAHASTAHAAQARGPQPKGQPPRHLSVSSAVITSFQCHSVEHEPIPSLQRQR